MTFNLYKNLEKKINSEKDDGNKGRRGGDSREENNKGMKGVNKKWWEEKEKEKENQPSPGLKH